MQELPTNTRQVGAGTRRAHEPLRPLLGVTVRQFFKNTIFQMRQHLRDTKARLVLGVIARVDCATDSATLTVLPIRALDQLVGLAVQSQLRENVSLDLRVVVISEH
jgi:hypothetical protein